MNNFRLKFRCIFLPFLAIALSIIGIYTLLDWLFVIKIQMVIQEDVVFLFIPAALPWLPIFFLLRPRVKILRLTRGRDPYYFLVPGVIIIVSTVLAQMYLSTATGKLTHLNNISEINQKPITKYYQIRNHYIDKRHISVFRKTEVTGKNRSDLNFYIYLVCPILDKEPAPIRVNADSKLKNPNVDFGKPMYVVDGVVTSSASATKLKPVDIESVTVLKREAAVSLYGNLAINGAVLIVTKSMEAALRGGRLYPLAWLGVEYYKQINNNLDTKEKVNLYKAFDKEAKEDFQYKQLDNFTYLDHIKNNNNYQGFKSATQLIPGYKVDAPIIMVAKTGLFKDRNGNKLAWLLLTFGAGSAIWFLMLLFPPIYEIKLDR